MANKPEKYTKPKLRERIKEDLKSSDKGGKPGQWSARKSQRLVQEYEKRGGGYTSSKKDEAAKSLEHWTDQDWQTIDGEADARRGGGVTKRYLPKAVWRKLSDEERRQAERTKTTRSKLGKQHVPWTAAIRRAFAEVEGRSDGSPSKAELYERARSLDIPGRSRMNKQELEQAIKEAE